MGDVESMKTEMGYESLSDAIYNTGMQVSTLEEELGGSIDGLNDSVGKIQSDLGDISGVPYGSTVAEALLSIGFNADHNTEAIGGSVNDLKTDAHTIISAINEVHDDAEALGTNMGNVDSLSTTNKTVVGAINEVLAAVGTGGTAAVVTITSDVTTDGALKSYTVKQGETLVGVIDIPKDMVVQSGEVVTNPEGQAEGTYIKLVLANATNDEIFINVGNLVDIYKAKAEATQVQIAIDPSTREISASIVAGSITSVELADNAVVTAKIADANVTKAKLSTEVQASLDKADGAAADAQAKANKALEDAKAYADTEIGKEKTRAEGIEAGLETRLQAVEGKLGDGEGNVDSLIEAAKQEAIDHADAADAELRAYIGELPEESAYDTSSVYNYFWDMFNGLESEISAIHDHENLETLNGITDEKVAAWDASEQNAKDYADGLNTEMNTRVAALESVSYVEITADEIDAMFNAEA